MSRSRFKSLKLPCYCHMACFTTTGFYYGPCGLYTLGLTVECSTTPPPPPCMCALMYSRGDVWCNGDCCINVLWQHRRAALSACSHWKEQRNERVTAAAEHLISQPNSPEEGLFKFGSVPRLSSYTQMADEESRDGFLLGQAILWSQLQSRKGPFFFFCLTYL